MDECICQDRLLDGSAAVLAANDQRASAIPAMPHSVRALPDDTCPIVRAAAASALIVGLLVLFGWAFDVPLLKVVFRGLVSMKVNAAIAFTFVGVSMALLALRDRYVWQLALARIVAIGVFLIGCLTLVEYVFHCDLGIDQWFIRDELTLQHPFPGRPSPATALNFCMLAFALLLLSSRRAWAHSVAQFLTLAVLLIAVIALAGYLFGADALYRTPSFSSMAIHTAATFILVSVGMLYMRPDFGIMAPLWSSSVGGVMARKIMPTVMTLPVILAWLGLQGQQQGYYDLQFGIAVLVVSNLTLFLGLMWWASGSLNRLDEKIGLLTPPPERRCARAKNGCGSRNRPARSAPLSGTCRPAQSHGRPSWRPCMDWPMEKSAARTELGNGWFTKTIARA